MRGDYRIKSAIYFGNDMQEILILIWLHFIGDFILQTDNMATKKSESEAWLLLHVSVYTIPFFLFGWYFAVANGVLHFITDYFTSKATSHLWKKDKKHWFFAMIGFDQAIHISTLLITYHLLVGSIWTS